MSASSSDDDDFEDASFKGSSSSSSSSSDARSSKSKGGAGSSNATGDDTGSDENGPANSQLTLGGSQLRAASKPSGADTSAGGATAETLQKRAKEAKAIALAQSQFNALQKSVQKKLPTAKSLQAEIKLLEKQRTALGKTGTLGKNYSDDAERISDHGKVNAKLQISKKRVKPKNIERYKRAWIQLRTDEMTLQKALDVAHAASKISIATSEEKEEGRAHDVEQMNSLFKTGNKLLDAISINEMTTTKLCECIPTKASLSSIHHTGIVLYRNSMYNSGLVVVELMRRMRLKPEWKTNIPTVKECRESYEALHDDETVLSVTTLSRYKTFYEVIVLNNAQWILEFIDLSGTDLCSYATNGTLGTALEKFERE